MYKDHKKDEFQHELMEFVLGFINELEFMFVYPVTRNNLISYSISKYSILFSQQYTTLHLG